MDFSNGIGDIDRKPTFAVTNENWLQKAILTAVFADKTEDTDNKKGKDCICFTFEDVERKVEYTAKFTWDSLADKAEDKFKWLQAKVAHIYNALTAPKAHLNVPQGEGKTAPLGANPAENSFAGFCAKVAKDFTTARNNAPIFQDEKGNYIVFHLKLTRQKTKTEYLEVPFPPFMEKFVAGRQSIITKSPQDVFDVKPQVQLNTNAGVNPTAQNVPPSSW